MNIKSRHLQTIWKLNSKIVIYICILLHISANFHWLNMLNTVFVTDNEQIIYQCVLLITNKCEINCRIHILCKQLSYITLIFFFMSNDTFYSSMPNHKTNTEAKLICLTKTSNNVICIYWVHTLAWLYNEQGIYGKTWGIFPIYQAAKSVEFFHITYGKFIHVWALVSLHSWFMCGFLLRYHKQSNLPISHLY